MAKQSEAREASTVDIGRIDVSDFNMISTVTFIPTRRRELGE